jgi:hypothetical protein
MLVRIQLPDGLAREDALSRLLKAIKSPAEGATREQLLARADAASLRAEFTGLFERILPDYESHIAALDEAIGRARGKKKAALTMQRLHVINSTEWQVRVHFNTHYEQQFVNGKRLASGRPASLQPNEREIIRRLVNNEVKFAMNALRDAETGEYTMDLERRGTLYGNAVNETLWLGYLYGDLSQDRFCRWVLSPAEDCIDCLWMAGRLDILQARINEAIAARQAKRPNAGPTPTEARYLRQIAAHTADQGGRWGTGIYRAQELARLGIVPQSGQLECTTNCKCHLQDVARPEGKTKQKEHREPFKSLMPKEPTMLKRRTLQPHRERLAELAKKWEHKHIRRA